MTCTCLLNVRTRRSCELILHIRSSVSEGKEKGRSHSSEACFDSSGQLETKVSPFKSAGQMAAKRKCFKMTNHDRSRKSEKERGYWEKGVLSLLSGGSQCEKLREALVILGCLAGLSLGISCSVYCLPGLIPLCHGRCNNVAQALPHII